MKKTCQNGERDCNSFKNNDVYQLRHKYFANTLLACVVHWYACGQCKPISMSGKVTLWIHTMVKWKRA